MNPKYYAPRAGTAHANEVLAARFIVALALVVLAFGDALAQQAQETDPRQKSDDVTTAPPPLRYVPDEVRRELDAERDVKARTHRALELAEERLARAAAQADAERFEEATAELGIYEAVVADAIRFVQTSSGRVTNKQRDILKHVEMTLRSHVPRIEAIRRTLPAAHAAYVKSTIEFVNLQRDQALNSFYDDTVMREAAHGSTGGKGKAAVGERANGPAVGERANGHAPGAPDNEKKPDQQ
jgi:hypothetical protein